MATRADVVFAAHQDTAFLLVFSKDNPYRDQVNHLNGRCEYKGQNRRKTFDNLLANDDVPMVLVSQRSTIYTIIGRCTARNYNAEVRVNGDIPVCHFTLQASNMQSTTDTPVARGKRHCYRQKFMNDYRVQILSGTISDGIMLVQHLPTPDQ